ncbi:MAG: hypothetical protein QOJ15_940 [Bradyrhizobium sp.]|nr:hypothetical protein [Bradyrhizobium sp.]
MAAISNLPPLKADKDSIEPPDMAGVWVRRSGASLLRKIADSLDHKDQAVPEAHDGGRDPAMAESVPDVWAQVEVFRSDLFYDGIEPVRSARKAKATAEWRGLLALLALKDRNAYSLQALPIDFQVTGTVGNEGAAATGAGPNDIFLAVCGRLLPKTVPFADQNWRNISILKVSGNTVGLIVPTTLVAPARDYALRLAGSKDYIPWFTTGRLGDPTQPSLGLRPRDYLLLAGFLRTLLDTVRTTQAGDAEMKNSLVGLLAAFEAESRALGASSGLSDTDVKRHGSLGLDLPVNQAVYAPLNNIFRTTGGIEHHTRVRPRAVMANRFQGVILHDPKNGFRQLGERATNLVLWGDLTQDRAMREVSALERARTDARAQGYLFVDVADLFTPRIIALSSGRAPRQGNTLDRFILPLSPVVLLLFEPDDLQNAIRIERTAANDIRVSLSLELVNEQGKLRATYAAERIYRQERKEIEERAVPVATSIWPDFRSDKWRFYTAFHRGQPRTDVCLTGALSAGALLQALPTDATGENTVALIARWMRGEALGTKEVPIVRTAEIASDLFVSNAPIEALACGIKQPSAADRPAEILGFVLTPPGRIVATNMNAQSGVVGIDFGTSNTCVYLKVGAHGTPTEAKYKNRQLLPLVRQAPDGSHRADPMAFSDFMPLIAADMPFLSLLKSREGTIDGIEESLPFGRSHIWFVSDLQDSMDKALSNDPHLHFNLKWSKVAEDRVRLRALLRQAALLGLAEATAEGLAPTAIEWAFSYPLTQNFNEKEYRQNCQMSVDGALEAAFGEPMTAKLIDEITESEAAAIYFRDRALTGFSGTTVTIDIGGGTSDISIWDGTFQVWRHSLELAGRKILLSYLRRRIDFFKELCRGARDNTALANIEKRLETPQFQSARAKTPKSQENKDANDPIVKMLELVINNAEFKDQLSHRLSDLSGEPDGATLKWVVTLALAGMVYFVGRQLSMMKDRVSIDTNQGVTICLSGRGSAIYRSLFSDVRELSQRLRVVFLAAAECDSSIPFSIVYSPSPKHEAAYGLVSDWNRTGDRNALTLKGPKRVDSPIIGETLRVDGERTLASTALATDTVGAKKLVVSELDEINRFLKLMAGLTASSRAADRPDGVHVDIEPHRATLIREINQELANWVKNSDPAKPSVREPVFLVALRLLVDLVNDGALKLVPVQ